MLRQAEGAFESVLIKPVTPSMLFDSAIQALSGDHEKVREMQTGPSVEVDLERLRGARVLLVEDNEINQEVALGLLGDAQMSIDVAENGEIAVRMVGEKDYDLVLMDMQMPVMDGVSATRAIRSNPLFRTLPVVAMTANAMASDREKCLEAGMNDHVSKPIDPDALFATLLRWIKPRSDQPSARPVEKVEAVCSQRIPDIEGIDVPDGLKRLAGNVRLYRDLIWQFAAKHEDAGLQISAALQSGDRKQAERIAHTVKGVAGNLGIKQIQFVAQELERGIRDGDTSVSTTLQDFTTALHHQIDSIEQALNTTAPAVPETESKISFDPAAASREVMRLRSLLEASDGDSEEGFRTLQVVLAGQVEKTRLDALGADISEFDFTGALLKLDDIARGQILNREEVSYER
jgi:CheY-like chemotaxis protein